MTSFMALTALDQTKKKPLADVALIVEENIVMTIPTLKMINFP